MTMAMLQSLLDEFHAAIIASIDGGTKARVLRDSLRERVIAALKHIARTFRRTRLVISPKRAL